MGLVGAAARSGLPSHRSTSPVLTAGRLVFSVKALDEVVVTHAKQRFKCVFALCQVVPGCARLCQVTVPMPSNASSPNLVASSFSVRWRTARPLTARPHARTGTR